MTGKQRRKKGHDFEREIARRFRVSFPGCVARRGQQSHRAVESDVVITDGPAALRVLWIECETGKQPSPQAKMRQAVRDAPAGRTPIVVWRKLRAKKIQATVRLRDLTEMVFCGKAQICRDTLITMNFTDLVQILADVISTERRADAVTKAVKEGSYEHQQRCAESSAQAKNVEG